MNLRSANSLGPADLPPPPPHLLFEIVLPNGRCSPATEEALKKAIRQARTNERRLSRIAREEKADELQRNLLDRRIAARFLRELAEMDRDSRRVPLLLRSKVRREPPERDTSNVKKRVRSTSNRAANPTPMLAASSWAVDDAGFRGVHYDQNYVGRSSPEFYRGIAKHRWEYEARHEAVIRDEEGIPCIVSNLGQDVDEIGVAWQAIEDATTRKNGKVQIRIIVAFDADANDAENKAALEHFCKNVLGALGLGYSAVMHNPSEEGDQRNKHAHILTHLRPVERVDPYCWAFSDEVRGELDGKNGVQMLRHLWAHSMSEAADRFGRDMQYTGLGYGARGLDLEPGEHLGEARSSMVRRGQTVFADERNQIKRSSNIAKTRLRDIQRKIDALTELRGSILRARESERNVNAVAPAPLRSSQMPASAPKVLIASSKSDNITTPLRVSEPATALKSRRLSTAIRREGLPTLTRSAAPIPPAARNVAHHEVQATNHPNFTPLVLSQAGLLSVQPPPSLQSSNAVSSPEPRQTSKLSASSNLGASLTNRKVLLKAQAPGNLSVSPRLKSSKLAGSDLTSTNGLPLRPADPNVVASSGAADANIALLTTDDQASSTPPRSPLKLASRVASTLDPLAKELDTMLSAISQHREAARRRATAIRQLRQRALQNQQRRTVLSEELPDREWFEANPLTALNDETATADRKTIDELRKSDIYIADTGDGILDIDPQGMALIGVTDEWRLRPNVQVALREIRTEQQHVMGALLLEAQVRPLDFSKYRYQPWPKDLEPKVLVRLERWSTHWGFDHDMFRIEQHVGRAHREAERKARLHTIYPARRITVIADVSNAPTPDRAPVVPAFEKFTGRPTPALLSFLRFVGNRPAAVGFDDNHHIIAGADVPPEIQTILAAWQADRRVASLVVETRRRSRKAGHAVLPPSIKIALEVDRKQDGPTGRAPGDRARDPFQ